MPIIKCPECNKEVSDKAYKCPSCGVVINKPKRGITGVIFKTLFLVFNAFMIVWFFSLIFIGSGDPELELGAAKAMGSGMLVFFWLLIGLPLGIMSYITRPKSND